MAQPVRISIVSYFNTLPFRWAIRHSQLQHSINMQEDIPRVCAEKLHAGAVDLALVPAALLADLSSYNVETDFCIGADGIVDSVKLYTEVPLQEINTVFLDYQSRSSIALTRILFRFFWKLDPVFTNATPGFEEAVSGSAAAVVIGDRTFTLNGRYRFEYDLAAEWKKFTGLPFVFAVWASTTPLDHVFIKAFNEVLQEGVNNISQAVAEAGTLPGISEASAISYLTERIDYRLDEKKREALDLFLSYLRML